MTDYTKTTNFTAKDSLASGNANKIVKGAEIDDEFDNIATAVATKSNIASPTFTGTVTGPTIVATTAFVPDASDGAALGTSSLEFSDLFLADGSVIYFGADQDVSLTHVADTGLLLSSTDQLQFGDSGTYIYQSADGVLDLVSDTEIEINATTIDINGAADVSGNLAVGGNLTVTGNATIAGNLTFGDAASDTVAFSADVASNLLPSADNSYDLGASGSEWKDLYIDGTANIDSLVADTADINGGTVDGAIIGGSSAAAITGTAITGTSFVIGSATITEAELEILDGATVTTAELNILDGVTSTAAELNILDGVTSTAAELNILDGVTSTAAELNILDGVTSTTTELNILDGVTASAADINLIDGITNGTVIASKAIITDSNKDITGGRNITISGELDAATLDISGDADIDGTLEADAITIGGVTLAETIADTVGAMVSSNTETNITVSYEDADNTLDFVIGTLNQDTTGTADNFTVSANNSADETVYPVFVDGATGSQGAETDTGLTYNPSTGLLTSTGFSGNLTGTLQTAAQTNITSVGTLTALTGGTGDFNWDSNTLVVDSSANRVGILNASPDVTLDVGSATDAVHVPSGTTAQRPTGAAGYFRYNSTTSKFEGYTDSWGSIGGGSGTNMDTNIFAGDGSDTTFTLSNAPDDEQNLMVFVDGVFQAHDAYSVSGTTLTFSAAPANGRVITVYHSTTTVGGSNNTINTMTGDNSDTTLTLSVAPVHENNVQVYFDGVYQSKSNYSISGTTLTFSTAPPTGVLVEAITNTNTSSTTANILLDADSDTKIQVEESSDEDKIRFDTGGTERMILDSSGLGLGTSSPTSPNSVNKFLHIHNADHSSLVMSDDQNTWEIVSNNNLTVRDGTDIRLTVDTAGKVGIGDTSPFAKIHVEDTGWSGGSPYGTVAYIQGGATNDLNWGHVLISQSGTTTDTGGRLSFGANGENPIAGIRAKYKRMVIDSAGKVGISTVSPQAELHVKDASAGSRIIVEASASGQDADIQFLTADDGQGWVTFHNGTDNKGAIKYNHASDYMAFRTNGVDDRINIDSAGSISMSGLSSGAGNADLRYNTGNGDVTYDTSSRLVKENIEDIPYGLEAVKNLSPKKYKRTDGGKEVEVGFIADEVVEVVPELVGMMAKSVFTKEESDTDEIAGSVNYSKMTAVLVKAVQEQQTLIETLQAEVKALKGE
jgi:cytoskeletal protein CcmA (bactofilin family)